jgi:MFS family permease
MTIFSRHDAQDLQSVGAPARIGRPLRVATVLQILVAAGNGLCYVALALRVYQETHSTAAVTMVLLAGGIPVVLLAPVAGLLLDRLPMGRLLSVAGLAVTAALSGLAFAHTLTATVLLVLCFGVADSILQPGLTAAVPLLAGDVSLVRATSRLQSAAMAGTAMGPLLAGVIGSLGGTTTALLLNAGVSAVFSAVILTLGLRERRVHPAEDEGGMGAGVRYLRADRPLGLLVLVTAAVVAFLGVTMVVELFLAEKVLHGGTTGYALLMTAWTGAMTLGTLIAGRLPARWLAAATVAGYSLLGLGVVAGAGAPTMGLAILAYAIGGIGDGVQLVGARTLLLQRAPEAIAGRATAVFTGLSFGGVSVGMAVAAPLVSAFGIRGALAAAGAGCCVASVLAVGLRLHHLQGVPMDAPARVAPTPPDTVASELASEPAS